MENNVHYLLSLPADFLPFQIWYPRPPYEATLRLGLTVRPQMKYPVAHACIVANYKMLWDELDITPNWDLQRHAMNYPNPYYKEDLERRAVNLEETRESDPEAWRKAIREAAKNSRAHSFVGFRYESSATDIEYGLNPLSVSTEWDHGPYDGLVAEAQRVGLYICTPDRLKNYVFQKNAGYMSSLYWKSEEEMHKDLEEELSRKIKNMEVKEVEAAGA
jgi:hypothetical protein